LKDQKKEIQKSYKQFLDQQAYDQQERIRNNRMTKDEKKINFTDLQVSLDNP
jgi:hypothetical protein